MQSFENVGFAIELFVVIFSSFCWLMYTPVSSVSAAEHEISRVKEPQKREEKELEHLERVDTTATNVTHNTLSNVTDCIESIEQLDLENSRKVASLLIGENLLPAEMKLAGKGITKVWLQKKIKSLLPEYQSSVQKALEAILQTTLP